jgi:hypothetical protein
LQINQSEVSLTILLAPDETSKNENFALLLNFMIFDPRLNLNRQRAATALSQLKISPSEASALPLSIAQALSRRCVEEV